MLPEKSQCARKTTSAPRKQPVRPEDISHSRKTTNASEKKPVHPENSLCSRKTAVLPEDIPRARKTTHVPGKLPVFQEKSACTLTLINFSLFLLDVLPSTVPYITINQHHADGVTGSTPQYRHACTMTPGIIHI
jgi:hypothetical protein